ncbi:hypothetical protein ACUHRZ_004845, partial [Raoultella planticola]
LSGNAHREQDNIAGNAVEPPEAGPEGGASVIRRRMHHGQPPFSKKPVLTDGLFAFLAVVGTYRFSYLAVLNISRFFL